MSIFKLAHTGDRHVKEKRRLGDTEAIMSAFADGVREADVDLVADAGDFFDAKSTAAERNLLAWHLRDLARTVPVFGCKGNHDADGDLDIFNRLDSPELIHIAERPMLNNSAKTQIFGHSRDRAAIHALPWFDKAHLLKDARFETTLGEGIDRATKEARQLLTAFRLSAELHRSKGITPILVAHAMVAGSTTSTGQTLIGQTVELSPADLQAAGFEYVALGHIHKRQEWYDGRVAYSGSPERMNLGEPEAKGWNLVTFEDGKFLRNEFIELPARKIELLEATTMDAIETVAAGGIDGYLTGALVRLRYHVRPEDLHLVDEAALERSLIESGAHEVKLEAVLLHANRVRSVEVVDAATTWAKLAAFWAANGIDVGEAQRERIQLKLAEVEGVTV